jgi:hypothetical protein
MGRIEGERARREVARLAGLADRAGPLGARNGRWQCVPARQLSANTSRPPLDSVRPHFCYNMRRRHGPALDMGAGEAAGGQGVMGRGGHGPALDMGAGEVAGGQRATVRGGAGPALDTGAGGAAGGLDVMVRGGRHGPMLDMGAGEATGGQGAMVRGGHGPTLDRSHRAGRHG